MKLNLQVVLLEFIKQSSATPALRDSGRILDSIIGYSQWGSHFNLCTNKRIKQKHVPILRMMLYYSATSGCIAIIPSGFGKWMRLNCLPVMYRLAHVLLCFSVIYLAHKNSDPLQVA